MGRWIRSASRALIIALAVTVPAEALAQKKGVDAAEQKARELYKQGQTAYDLGDFDKALGLYGDAYKQKALPGFLFNMAQCQRQKGNFKEAAFLFGRFLDNTNPTAPNVELARELLEDMKRRQADADAKAEEARLAEEKRKADEAKKDAPLATNLLPKLDVAPPPPPPPVEPETPVYKKGWFWAVVGGAVVAVAGGTATAVVLSKRRTATTPPSTTLPDISGR